VPSRAPAPARVVLGREDGRRRAVDALRLAESIAAYGARQLANGLSPEQARRAAIDVAAELELIAAELRRLATLTPAERRRLAAELAASGMSDRAIAEAVGVDRRTVWADLHARS
jgi:DNA-binding NarL/FixJ family response regulator